MVRKTIIKIICAAAFIPAAGLSIAFSVYISPANTFGRLIGNKPTEIRLRQHVQKLAGEFGARNTNFHRQSLWGTEDYLKDQIKLLGFKPEVQTVPSDFEESSNIYIEAPGSSKKWIVVGAHYDSFYDSPGADDNATGVAALLEILRDLPDQRTVGLIAVFFTNEEPPFFQSDDMGSRHFADKLATEDKNILGMVSLDMLGYYSESQNSQEYPWYLQPFFENVGDFVALGSNYKSDAFMRLILAGLQNNSGVKVGGIVQPEFFPSMRESDHDSFWQKGINAVLLSDSGYFRNPYYHLTNDLPNTIDYHRLADLSLGLRKTVHKILLGSKQEQWDVSQMLKKL